MLWFLRLFTAINWRTVVEYFLAMRESESPLFTIYVSVSEETWALACSAGLGSGSAETSPEAGIFISWPIWITDERERPFTAMSSESVTRCFWAMEERLSPLLTT